MNIPGLGEFEKDDDLGWHFGPSVALPVLGGQKCRIVFDGYDGDERPEDFHAAATHFLSIGEDVLKQAAPFVFHYYQDCIAAAGKPATIAAPAGVWAHVQFGDEVQVTRRAHGDRGVYVSLSCSCDWEPEHGLQFVFKNGLVVNKVGAYDGHLTNSDAYAEDSYEDVVYVDRETVKRRIAARTKPKATAPKASKPPKKEKAAKPAKAAQKAKPAKKTKPVQKVKPVKKPKPAKKVQPAKKAKPAKKAQPAKKAKPAKKGKR
jgi:hypothetical protein